MGLLRTRTTGHFVILNTDSAHPGRLFSNKSGIPISGAPMSACQVFEELVAPA